MMLQKSERDIHCILVGKKSSYVMVYRVPIAMNV